MDRSTIQQKTLSVLRAVLRPEPEAGPDATRENMWAWNSLRHLELMFALEEELGIEFSRGEFAELRSVAAIVDLVAAKLAS